MANRGDKKMTHRKECFTWKNLVFCLIVIAILLQIVGYNRSQDDGGIKHWKAHIQPFSI